MIKDATDSLHDLIVRSVEVLHEPAGEKYRSIEDIQRNRDEFVKDFHTGLFLLHVMTTQLIIDLEDKMRSPGSLSQVEAKTSKKGWTRVRQIFRCINDSIVWSVLQPEPAFLIRRMCREQERGNLRDQNPESVMKAMEHYFAGGEALPIWNDATRCLDISDITVFSRGGVSFLELKTGKVNERILEMMAKTDTAEILADLDVFSKQYGEKGMKQIERIVRQDDRAGKLLNLVRHDDVFDPFLNAQRVALTPNEPLKEYDQEMAALLDALRSKDFVEHSVDGCLHILALNLHRDIGLEKGRELIRQHLKEKVCRIESEEVDCSDVVLSLDSSFYYPTAMPIMLRRWAGDDIARVSLGHIQVYFLFDVNAWAKHLRKSNLVWSTIGEGRKELSKPAKQRLLTVQGRIPQIVGPKGGQILLGTRFLQAMLCEGIRPMSLAEFYDQMSDFETNFESAAQPL